MSKKILVNIDLGGNELQNAVVHALAAAPTAIEGKIYYNTTDKVIYWYDGTTWQDIRTINDAGTSTTDLWSADKIQTAIDNAITAAVTYKGGYDAATNTPNLDATPIAITKGDMYTVTAGGTFFTETVSIGDVIIAEIDSAAVLADWTIVEKNLNTATETSEGIAEIATQAETDAGTDDVRFITPLKLVTYLNSLSFPTSFSVNLDSAEGSVARVFAGGQTTYTVTHGLNTLKTHVTVRLKSSEEEVVIENSSASVNTTDIVFNGNSTDNTYNVYISG